jgi:hypothetical protein
MPPTVPPPSKSQRKSIDKSPTGSLVKGDRESILQVMRFFVEMSVTAQDEVARGICLEVLKRHKKRLVIVDVSGDIAGYLVPFTTHLEQLSHQGSTSRIGESEPVTGRDAKLQRLRTMRE